MAGCCYHQVSRNLYHVVHALTTVSNYFLLSSFEALLAAEGSGKEHVFCN